MISLEETKMHLRVDSAYEDAHIAALIEAAIASVADFLDMEVEDLGLAPMPAPVRAAILLRVGDLYAHREAQFDQPLTANAAFAQLLNPYRSLAL